MREINRCKRSIMSAQTVDCIRHEELSRLCFVNTQDVSVSVGRGVIVSISEEIQKVNACRGEFYNRIRYYIYLRIRNAIKI